jgi:hypothetical protein
MADRSSDESAPDQTRARSATSGKTASGTRTSTGSTASQASKTSQRKTAQPRKSPSTRAGTSGTTPEATGGSNQTGPRPETPTPGPSPESAPLTDRINAAYASSGPVVPDDAPPTTTGDGSGAARTAAEPTGAERFPAAKAGTSGTAEKPKSGTPRPWESPRRVRKARLRVTHVDPWSVMKTAFLLAVAIGIVTVVAVAVVWSVLDAAGVWGSIDKAVGDVVGESSNNFRIEDYLGLSRVLGFTLIVAVVDVVLVTVIATLGAFLYNLAAALLGGVEVVLAEEEH